ncbi:MAG: hypothetical protein JNK72_25150 [Myxococcales bacterium]|nr:hypothetical protein [Myxococcales bacterium]
MRANRFVFALALALSAPACASFHVNTPSGFAELDDDAYDYRATSADGVVLAVRALRNRPSANLAFWSRAIDERMQQRGYTPDGEPRPVQSADGYAGVQYRYVIGVNGRPHRYWVTVYVKSGAFLRRSRVYIVEAGGDRETFEGATPLVERAITAFRCS